MFFNFPNHLDAVDQAKQPQLPRNLPCFYADTGRVSHEFITGMLFREQQIHVAQPSHITQNNHIVMPTDPVALKAVLGRRVTTARTRDTSR